MTKLTSWPRGDVQKKIADGNVAALAALVLDFFLLVESRGGREGRRMKGRRILLLLLLVGIGCVWGQTDIKVGVLHSYVDLYLVVLVFLIRIFFVGLLRAGVGSEEDWFFADNVLCVLWGVAAGVRMCVCLG